MVMGSPQAEAAQPRALIGGHLLSTLVGLLAVKLLGPVPWVAALAVGFAMIAMHLTGTFHPPAGIDPLVIVVNNLSWGFLIAPVGAGALLLALFAFAWQMWSRAAPTRAIFGRRAGGDFYSVDLSTASCRR